MFIAISPKRTFHQPARVPIQTYWQYVWYSIALKTINHLMFCLKRLVCAHRLLVMLGKRFLGTYSLEAQAFSKPEVKPVLPVNADGPMVRNSAFLKCLASLDISWVPLNWSIPTTGYPMCTVYIIYRHIYIFIDYTYSIIFIDCIYIYIYIHILIES